MGDRNSRERRKKIMATGEYKIVVVGAGGVGKSGLTLQFCAGKCPKRYDPTIEDSYRKTTEVDTKPCCLDILDTAGQEEYASLRGEYMTEGKGFVLVYSVTAKDTFDDMDKFRDQIEKNKNDGDKVPLCLVGNKIDLQAERKVTKEEGEAKIKEWKEKRDAAGNNKIGEIIFMETSAMQDTNVDETFKGLVRLMQTSNKPAAAAAPAGGDAKKADAVEGPKPNESGDKPDGCKCVIS